MNLMVEGPYHDQAKSLPQRGCGDGAVPYLAAVGWRGLKPKP
jgi:hypothetical protein